MKKCVLVAGGLDPSGGAGLSSDIKACAFFNTYPLPVATAITYQNSKYFNGFDVLNSKQVEKQLKSILNFYPVEFAKIGLTGRGEILDTLVSVLFKNNVKIVFDPVLKTSTEGVVSDDSLVDTIVENSDRFFLITPNIDEAKRIGGLNSESQIKLGERLLEMGFKNILVKGGHLEKPDDVLITRNGVVVFEGEKLETENTRGTGCALSSAIASNLALGKTLKEAVAIAKNYVLESMKHSCKVGIPPYPLNLMLK